MSWLPIESAPKDGTRVLLFGYASTWGGGKDLSKPLIAGGRCESGTFSRMVPVEGTDYFRNEDYESHHWAWDEAYLSDNSILPPTHWMPLPEPPK